MVDLLTSQPNDHLTVIFSYLDGLCILRGLSVSKRYAQYALKYYATIAQWLNKKMRVSLEQVKNTQQFRRVFTMYSKSHLTEIRIIKPALRFITVADIKTIITRCPNLQLVKLNKCPVDDATVLEISKLPALHTLDLGRCNRITSYGTDIFHTFKNLISLTICWNTHMFNYDLRKIAKNCLGLRYLDISGCHQITDKGIISVAKRCADMRDLNVGCCQISDIGMWAISHLKKITSLNVRFCTSITDLGMEYISKLENLTCLDISNCSAITEEGMKFITGRLKKLNNIHPEHTFPE